MKGRMFTTIVAILVITGLLGINGQALAEPLSPAGIGPEYTYNTVITVTSGKDLDTSKSKTCASEPVCTLRRAIVESRNLPGGQLPVLIEFNIPKSAAEGWNSALGVWELRPLSSADLYVFRRLKGQVIIDGSTQPGGRTTGPKIILIGPGTGQKGAFVVGDFAGQDQIMIIGLGLQNFKTHIYVNTDDNLIEDNWFGLSSDGTTLTSGHDWEHEGGSAIGLTAGAERNIIRGNKFAGFFGAAVAIRGASNEFSGNRVGMRADGTVPIPAQFDKHPCSGHAWAGGSGITVEGDDHIIGGPQATDANRFAGLYLDIFGLSEMPFAIEFKSGSEDVLIQNNIIGVAVGGASVGICGRGIKLSTGPERTQVLDNTIVNPGLSAILLNHWTLQGNTLRGNIIKRSGAWPGKQGNNKFAEDAIAMATQVPAALLAFQPARITKINGKNVTGKSGVGSPCPSCIVEVFLDDTDTISETLRSLAVVTASTNGNWTATLPSALTADQGLRMTSTVPDDWTITGLDGGSTSRLSPLYVEARKMFLPLVVSE